MTSPASTADVYGLGGVLYFAVTGTPPFEDPNSAKLLRLHVSAQPEPPSDRLGRALPPQLEAVILRCLTKSPRDRYADAGELSAALDECIAHRGERPPTTEPALEVDEPTPAPEPRHRTAAYGPDVG